MPMPAGAGIDIGSGSSKIHLDVVIDGYEKGITPGEGPWRTVVYQCDWDRSDAAMDMLQGLVGAAGFPIAFPLPHAYPNNTRLYCHEVRAQGIGPARDDPKLIAFDGYAHIFATYRIPRYDIPGTDTANDLGGTPIPYSRVSKRGSVEMVRVPASLFETKGDAGSIAGEPIDKDRYIRIPNIHYTIQRWFVPNLDDYALILDSLGGKINSDILFGRPAGTWLLESWDVDWDTMTDGSRTEMVALEVVWRPKDWNSMPHDINHALVWDRDWDGTGVYGYQYDDLTPAFLFGLA